VINGGFDSPPGHKVVAAIVHAIGSSFQISRRMMRNQRAIDADPSPGVGGQTILLCGVKLYWGLEPFQLE
jgi:hypothetical protein